MKKIFFVLSILTLLIVPTSFGQINDLKLTRQQIKQQLENRDWAKVGSIQVNNHPNLMALSMRETEWFYLFRKDYGTFFAAIDFNEPHMSLIEKRREVYFDYQPLNYRLSDPVLSDDLNALFIDLFNADWQILLDDVENAAIADDLKQFIRYYIRFTLYQLDVCNNEKQRKSLDEAELMIQDYSYSKYAGFVNKYSSDFRQPTNWGYGVSVGGGYNQLGGTIQNTLRSHLYFLISLDLSYKRFVWRTDLGFGFSRVKSPYFFEVPHELGRQINMSYATSMLGYNIAIGDQLLISPLIGMDISMMRGGVVKDVDPESLVFPAAFSTGLAYGISIEYNFSPPECIAKDEFGRKISNVRHSSSFLRLSVNRRAYPMAEKIPELNGSAIYFNLTVGGFAQLFTTKRIKE